MTTAETWEPLPELPRVSVLVVVRNGVATLEACLRSIWAQDYPAPALEILLLDGHSEDGTVALARRLAAQSPLPMRILDNPQRVLAPGWNLGIRNSSGQLVVRVDSQSRLAPDYIRTCAGSLRRLQAADPHIWVVGGRRLTAAHDDRPWAQAIAAAQQSRIGVGGTDYRFAATPQFVDTIAMGVYDRRAFERVGYFDEALGRTEDNDFHARLRAMGGKIYLESATSSCYHARGTLPEVLRQMYLNGWWIGATIRRQRKFPFRPRHVAPLALVVGAVLATGALLAGVPGAGWLLGVGAGAYAAMLAVGVVVTCRRSPGRCLLVLAGMHASYGCGTLVGLAQGTGAAAATPPAPEPPPAAQSRQAP